LEKIADRGAKAAAERAIEILYLEFNRAVRNYIWKTFSQDDMLIEEVSQDTFMEVWKHPDRFRGESKFKTWLLGIARHKTLDSLRKRGQAHETLDDFEADLIADEMTVADMIQQEQIQNALKFCLENLSAGGKLSPEHREVLHLAYVDDQTVNEMAHILDCLENTIKTRLHYARQRIKKCLEMRLSGGLLHG
jgi:RNA polymerase sigma-70 factor (ECF subfamily)